ncbi:MAG: hypothetical protein IPF41_04575 [Flavobacteriales bacterium]|nr:hypothetical protein [Flavobacteriales bacterium]
MSNQTEPFSSALVDPLAETLAIQALHSGKLDPRHVLLRSIGQHGRSQTKDVHQVSTTYVPMEDIDLMVLTVRRDGLYDNLPEALFHEAGSSKEPKRNKAEDQHAASARSFFLPFEQETFRLRLALLEDELTTALGKKDKQRADALARIWDLPDDLDPRVRSAMLRLLPWLNRAECDLELGSSCFSFVIGHPVTLRLARTGPSELRDGFEAALGQSALGHCVAGACMDDGWPVVEVLVSELPLATLDDPMHRRALRRTLEVLSMYLLPAHLDVRYSFSVLEDDESATIGDPERPGILALNLRL